MQNAETLKKRRDIVLSEVPVSYRSKFERAYAGKSRSAAISAFCLACVGYLRVEVRDCTSYACPLWESRPYQGDKADDELPGAAVATDQADDPADAGR